MFDGLCVHRCRFQNRIFDAAAQLAHKSTYCNICKSTAQRIDAVHSPLTEHVVYACEFVCFFFSPFLLMHSFWGFNDLPKILDCLCCAVCMCVAFWLHSFSCASFSGSCMHASSFHDWHIIVFLFGSCTDWRRRILYHIIIMFNCILAYSVSHFIFHRGCCAFRELTHTRIEWMRVFVATAVSSCSSTCRFSCFNAFLLVSSTVPLIVRQKRTEKIGVFWMRSIVTLKLKMRWECTQPKNVFE